MRVVRLALAAALSGAALLLLAACGPETRSVSLKTLPAMPPARLYERLPIDAVLLIGPDIAHHRAVGTHTAYDRGNPRVITNFDLDFGDFHSRLLQAVLSDAFASVQVIRSGDPVPAAARLLIEPRIEQLVYGGGAQIRYAVTLRRPDTSELARIASTGTAAPHNPEARWLDIAMRDAAAEILVELSRSEPLLRWIEQSAGARPGKTS